MRLGFLVIVACLASASAARAQQQAQQPQLPQPQQDPPSKTLERALKLHEKKDYYSASIELHKVVAGETRDTPPNVGRAQLALAVVLYQLGYHAASLAVLAQIVQAGPAHARYLEAGKAMVDLAATAGAPVGGYLRAYYADIDAVAARLDEVTRSGLFYLLGAELAAAGDADAGRGLLVRVPRGSPYHTRARLELASLEIRRGAPPAGFAVEIAGANDFARASEAARTIAARRYSAGELASARAALQTLAKVSPLAAFSRSRFELEQAGTVPALADVPSDALEAVGIATACARGWSSNVLPQIAETAQAARIVIARLLAEGVDDGLAQHEAVERFFAKTAAKPAPAELAIRIALARIGAPASWHAELEGELQLAQRSDKVWQTTPIGEQVVQELTLQRSLAQAEIGKRYRERLAGLHAGLDSLGALAAGAPGPVAAGPSAAMGRGLLVSDDTCAAAQLRMPVGPRLAGAPGGRGAVGGRGPGCAGCASQGEPPLGLGLGLGLALLLVARARRR